MNLKKFIPMALLVSGMFGSVQNAGAQVGSPSSKNPAKAKTETVTKKADDFGGVHGPAAAQTQTQTQAHNTPVKQEPAKPVPMIDQLVDNLMQAHPSAQMDTHAYDLAYGQDPDFVEVTHQFSSHGPTGDTLFTISQDKRLNQEGADRGMVFFRMIEGAQDRKTNKTVYSAKEHTLEAATVAYYNRFYASTVFDYAGITDAGPNVKFSANTLRFSGGDYARIQSDTTHMMDKKGVGKAYNGFMKNLNSVVNHGSREHPEDDYLDRYKFDVEKAVNDGKSVGGIDLPKPAGGPSPELPDFKSLYKQYKHSL